MEGTMAEHVRPQDSSHIDNVDVEHEHRDVNVRLILAVAGGLVVTAVIVHLAMFGLFRYFEEREAVRKPRAYPLASLETQLPPEPRIQARPAENLMELQRRDQDILSNYGWVDERAGIARIPIEQAMRLTVERGLPTRAPSDQRK
jgi:hypothetical protein